MTIEAVDIRGTRIAVGMVDEDGRTLSRIEFPGNADHHASSLGLTAFMLRGAFSAYLQKKRGTH
jgi:predicted NBD/HSP70 family sugar kinase